VRRTLLYLALTSVGVGCANSDPIVVGTSGDETSNDVSSSPSSDATTAGVGASSAGGSGGSTSTGMGGAGPICGDGTIDANEECDDANLIDGDGCTTCVIDCEAGASKEPTSGHCYRFYLDAKTWPLAEGDCEAWGGAAGLGHLVSIANTTEQAFVVALRPGSSAWLGGRDTVTEGTFTWLDGTLFSFTSFAPGKPDGGTVQNCLFMRGDNDGWDDHECGVTEPGYVCERGAAGKTP
jgi:cysteine-rich repeat protein